MENRNPLRLLTYIPAALRQPLALLGVGVLAYGLMIPWLGLYWDDWVYTWFPQVLGTQAFVQIFAADRPFLSLIYMVTTPLIGANATGWHVFGLLTRWLASLGLCWSLKQIWPGHERQAFWTALLVLVFPGFGQQWMSLIYSNAFILLAGHLASLGLTARAARTQSAGRRWLLTALALLAAAFSLFSTEYFYGLEVLRLLLVWVLAGQLAQGWRARSLKALALAWPYALFLAAYTVWRAFLFKSENYQVTGAASLAANPLNALVLLVQGVVNTLVKACLTAWTQTLDLLALPFNRSATWMVWGVMLAAGLLAFFFLTRGLKSSALQEDQPGAWGSQAALPGLLGVAAAMAPFWAAGLGVGLEFPWDRFMLAMMVPASLFAVGLVDYLARTDTMKAAVLALLVGLAVGQHFDKANTFRRDWNNQQAFFWQLAWRIPGLQPDTMLLTHELPFTYYSDNSLTAPLNWTYAPDLRAAVGDKMPYILVYTKARLGNSLPTLQPDTPLKISFRALEFEGRTSDAVVVYYSNAQCLRVMDAQLTPAQFMPDLPYQLTDAVPLSNLARISTAPQAAAEPPARFFAPEPAHGWCYAFEKAELARQMGQWETVIQYLRDAESQGLEPLHPSEWLPFIEAYAQSGDWPQAEALAQRMLQAGDDYLPVACSLWARLARQEGTAGKAAQQVDALHCADLEAAAP